MLILSFSLILYFAKITLQDCAFSIDCDTVPDCLPYATPGRKPVKTQYSANFICGQMFPGETCCNDHQNNQIASNFLQIDATFGSIGNGCDNCASNIKRFWCTYTCSPNQADFVKTFGYKNVTNPIDTSGESQLYVQDVEVTVDSDTVCDLWKSCNLTPYANQVSAMKTPAGFLAFQGANAVTSGGQTIRIVYTSDEAKKPLKLENITKCNEPQPPIGGYNGTGETKYPWFGNQFGFNISQSCSCNNCADSCTQSQFKPLPVMQGFDWLVVGLFYLFVVVLSFVMLFFRRRKHKLRSNSSQVQQEESVADLNRAQ